MKDALQEKVNSVDYWYHRIELPGGIVTPGWAPIDASKYGIPDDLTGKRVLDVGAWDGFWTFEALKRGARAVLAIDDFSDELGQGKKHDWTAFDICREALGFTDEGKEEGLGFNRWKNSTGQICGRLEKSIDDLDEEFHGRFDIIFFFGTIYHLKNPFGAMEKLASLCDGEIYIESAVCDDYSPYRGGVGHGYPNNDAIMEFYPQNQYGGNDSNWFVPTLQCLGSMADAVGFKNIQAWALDEAPRELPGCRGFVYGSKTGAENEKVTELSGQTGMAAPPLSVAAVMSVPRLAFMDNMFTVMEAAIPQKIPVIKVQGAFWGQCLERGMMQLIDEGVDAVLTIDYDTVFSPKDLQDLIQLMREHPEADAIVPLQTGRAGMRALLTMKSKSGNQVSYLPRVALEPDLTKISTAHFGLSLFRTESLLKIPHPWFKGEPNADGLWGEGRIDDDIWFWKQAEKAGLNIYSANRIVLGHLELIATWPDQNLMPLHQGINDFRDNGKPKNAWK